MFNSVKIAIFISGAGSNAKNLIHYFSQNTEVEISFVISEKINPELEQLCNLHEISFIQPAKHQVSVPDYLIKTCLDYDINFIVLAGFLKKIPEELIQKFPEKIVNIHPSLLPKFGGKGMYGDYVHRAVLEANEKESGITIHLVNEEYDKGKILAQFSVPILPDETVETLREKIKKLEHTHLPRVIQTLLLSHEKTTI
jgi:phosphoribosylglycinamide formyltransferase-1